MKLTAKQISEYYQNKHRIECKKTNTKIPQTMLGKQIRYIIKLIDNIEVLSK